MTPNGLRRALHQFFFLAFPTQSRHPSVDLDQLQEQAPARPLLDSGVQQLDVPQPEVAAALGWAHLEDLPDIQELSEASTVPGRDPAREKPISEEARELETPSPSSRCSMQEQARPCFLEDYIP